MFCGLSKNRNRRKAAGFTLTEALVSSVIFCSAATVIMAISAKCMDRTRENRLYETAWQLLERQLTAVSYIGIDEFKKQGIMAGEFKGTEPVYSWAVESVPSTILNVDDVKVTVSWLEQKRPRSISVMTRMRSVVASEANSMMMSNEQQSQNQQQ